MPWQLQNIIQYIFGYALTTLRRDLDIESESKILQLLDR